MKTKFDWENKYFTQYSEVYGVDGGDICIIICLYFITLSK